jgi:hypothetical protein
MRRTIRLAGQGTGFGDVLKEAMEELGFECSLEGGMLSIESAPLSQEVPKRRLMKVVEAYEDLYYNFGAADLALSPDPLVDEVLMDEAKAELRGFAEDLGHDPRVLLSAVMADNNVPASVVRGIYLFLRGGDASTLKEELVAYLEGS